MKLYAFEVRPDEIPYFNRFSEETGISMELSKDILTLEGIPELEEGAGVSILGMGKYGPREMAALASRKICALSTRTVGYNHIDLNAAKEYGIPVCSASYAPNGVADHTVMMILLCLRHYKQAMWRQHVNDYSLGGLIGREMKDLTIGVIGTGRIGAQVIRNLSGFGCRILAFGHHVNESIQGLAEYVSMDDLLHRSDVITLHVPLDEETFHLINTETLKKCRDGVVIINCARGGLTDMSSLIQGIESEKIGALGLDCVEQEEGIVHRNLKTDIFSDRDLAYLRQFKNVVYTQHMAFYTEAAVESMVECGVKGIAALAEGKPYKTQLC